MPRSAKPNLLQRFWRDRRGVAAIEFAVIAPVMITFYYGMTEVTQAMMADRRNSHVASAVGDLVTQSSQISTAELTDIFSIGQKIMAPFPSSTLKMRVMGVSVNATGVAKVDWCDVSGLTDLADGATVTLPANLVANGESIVIAESSYTYDSPLDRFIPSALTFSVKIYMKPRRSNKVMRSA